MLNKKIICTVTSMFVAVLLIVLSVSAPVGALTEVSATNVATENGTYSFSVSRFGTGFSGEIVRYSVAYSIQ